MTDDEVTDLVFLRDDPVSGDLAMVFAASSEVDMASRVGRGVELYRAGLVPKVLVTGGGVLARLHPESKRMAQLALEMGVEQSDLLVEGGSSNTFENAEFSAELLETVGLLKQLKTVLLISSEWHMRRVLLTTMKYFPVDVRFVCCPTTEGCNADNWTRSDACRREVTDEANLLAALLQVGALSG